MNKRKTQYETPTMKVVIFRVEAGFADSPYTINQVETEEDGMVEQMNYDEGNQQLGWDWHIN